MATTTKTKTKTPKKKVVIWEKVVEKALAPYQKKFDKLFSDFKKEAAMRPMSTSERNELWSKKYEKKYKALDRSQQDAINKLWLKYHYSLSSTAVKPGYILK